MASISFKITRDDISPALSRLAAAAKNPTAVFRSMGTTFMSLTMGNFKSAEYRPAPWPAKRDGTPSTLQKSGTLSRSFHLDVGSNHATVKATPIYAAIHQFGSEGHVAGKQVGQVKTKYANKLFKGSWQAVMSGGSGIPARPFFPVEAGHLTPKAEEKIKAAGQRALARQAGLP